MKAEKRDVFIGTLKLRFEQHGHRHPGVEWSEVLVRLLGSPQGRRML